MSIILFNRTEIAQRRRFNKNNSQDSESEVLSSDSDTKSYSTFCSSSLTKSHSAAAITDGCADDEYERSTVSNSKQAPSCDGSQSDFDAMKSVFENFVLQLEEMFLRLKNKDYTDGFDEDPLRKVYKDICKRLRLDVLVALDKLELHSISESFTNEEVENFTRKMGNLKSQLYDIRWEYHGYVRDLRLQKYMLNNSLMMSYPQN